MLDRKHFEKVAEIIKGIPAQLDIEYDDIPVAEKTRNIMANNLADYFEEESAYFDKIKFLDACDLNLGDEE